MITGDPDRLAHDDGRSTGRVVEPSKHVRDPVWQAGPSGRTVTSTVSPSQSSRTPRTHCRWPLVSPLTQYSFRLREKKVDRPVVSVRCSAVSSIQPTMSTSPVPSCWTTAVTRPRLSRLRRAAIWGSSSAVCTPPFSTGPPSCC